MDLFFIISGFIICFATKSKEEKNLSKFVVRRVFRIYPLLMSCLILYYFFALKNPTFISLAKSIIPINANYHDVGPFFGYNLLPPAWTLSFEILFYSLFLLSMSISHKFRGAIVILIIIGLIVTIQGLSTGNVTLEPSGNFGFGDYPFVISALLSTLSSPMMIYFAMGVAIYLVWERIYCFKLINKKDTFLIFATIVLIICLSLLWSGQFNGHGIKRWGWLAAVVVITSLIIEGCANIKKNRVLSFLGDISYSLYLTHLVFLFAITKREWFYHLYKPSSGVSTFLVFVSLSILLAYIFHKVIEVPAIKLGKRFVSKM